MDSVEFGKKCQPYNKEFKKIFGYVPCPGDYACSQDTFFKTLEASVTNKQDGFSALDVKTFIFDEHKHY